MGVLWNANVGNGYYLAFNKELITEVVRITNNNQHVITDVDNLHVLYPMYEKNLISIRRVGAEFLIYINKQLVLTVSCDRYYGNNIGYFVGKGSELRVYSLVVSYLE